MKATIEPQKEKNVVLVMTETEARIIFDYIGAASNNKMVIYSEMDNKIGFKEVDNLTFKLYCTLNSCLEGDE